MKAENKLNALAGSVLVGKGSSFNTLGGSHQYELSKNAQNLLSMTQVKVKNDTFHSDMDDLKKITLKSNKDKL
jgi:uncharacterized protein YaaN involved in tellurite resistance